MSKILSAAAVVCASLALAAACARGGSTGVADSAATAQKQSTQQSTQQQPTTTQKPAAPNAKQSSAARPKVSEIKEDGLKSLLRAGEARERPLLVNFWATWCVPCREEFPDLVKLRERYAAERLDLALVSLDDASDIETAVPDFLLESGAAALPAYLLHAEDDNTAINSVDPTWGGELPATFLYDRAGRVVFSRKGRIKPAELQAAIDKLIEAGPRPATSGQ